MPVEMIGWIAPRVSSELIPPSGPAFDASVIAETARIHERAGFDRVLIGYFSDAPDGFLVGAHAAAVTERLSFLLAHRPGFVAPPVAARKLATLDQLSDGRLAVHIISGGSDADQAKDGDWTDPETRYRRAAEYIPALVRGHRGRMSAPSGCCRPPGKPRCTTPACGHRSPWRPARKATRRPWSVPPRRSPGHCSNTTSSAPPAC